MEYNNAIPLLMNEYLPNGMLGLALVGLIAAFMAGVAANVSAFNTVVTYDLWEPYVKSGKSDDYYLNFGRIATVVGIVIGIATALIASGYDNIMDYIQLLFSFFNAPLFATFIIGMFWKRMTPWAGLLRAAGGHARRGDRALRRTSGAGSTSGPTRRRRSGARSRRSWPTRSCPWCVTFVTTPKPVEELQGLVYGMAAVDEDDDRRPSASGTGVRTRSRPARSA